MAEQTYKTKVIYSGCGCETIKHFPDFCPKCRIAELERLADKVKNGFQGGCWCCETVGMKNVELHAKLERATIAINDAIELSYYTNAGDNMRGILTALKDNSG